MFFLLIFSFLDVTFLLPWLYHVYIFLQLITSDESGLSSDEENYVNWSDSSTDYCTDTDEEYNPSGAESDDDKNECCH